MARISIKWKLNIFSLVITLMFALILYVMILPLIEKKMLSEREGKLEAIVNSAISMMEYYENGIRTHKWKYEDPIPQTRAEARKIVLNNLQQVRYDEDECIFILDGSYNMIMHPLKPEFEGQNMLTVTDPNGGRPFREMVLNSVSDGKTFVRYSWLSKWSQSVYEPQTTFAVYFYPWDWVVCSSVYTQDIKESVTQITIQATIYFIGAVIVSIFLLNIVGTFIVQPVTSLAKEVQGMTNRLEKEELKDLEIKSNDEIGDLAQSFNLMISELRNNMEKLKIEKQRRERLIAILESTSDLVSLAKSDTEITYINKAGLQMLGYSDPSQIKELKIKNIHPKETLEKIENVAIPTAHKNGIWSGETAVITSSGEITPVSQVIMTHKSLTGEIEFYSTIMRDITAEKRAEEELRNSESKYRNLIEQSNDAIYILQGSTFILVNQKFVDMFGYESHEILNPDFDFMNLVSPLSHDLIRRRERMYDDGITPTTQYEFLARNKDGKDFEVEASISKIANRDDLIIQGTIRDISERKRLEERVSQTQKMEAVGRLAGGVAHDFNNLLTAILGSAELAGLYCESDSKQLKYINDISDTAERAASLTKQLLAFSRKQMISPTALNLNDVLDNMKRMLSRIIGEDIQLKFEQNSELWNIRADINQVEQIIVNIMVNARDAMPNGGMITFETENVTLDENYLDRNLNESPGDYILLAISDTGIGISKEIVDHIFEPFFTTKGVEKGTGLGLATVYGIIKQNKGLIRVYSEGGRGTTFKIYLPRYDAEIVEIEEKSDKKIEPVGKEKILVVEDEEVVKRLLENTLAEYGYEVLTASNGNEALEIVERANDSIDLLLTDVVMPHMSGSELATIVSEKNPRVKIIYMSGYTEDAIVDQGILKSGINFIYKPFGPSEIAKKVRNVLDA